MKTSRNSLAAPTLALFSALFFTGCYTQFVLADGDADEEYRCCNLSYRANQPGCGALSGCRRTDTGSPRCRPRSFPWRGADRERPRRRLPAQPKRDSGKQRVPPVPTIPSPAPSSRSGGPRQHLHRHSVPAPVTVAPAPAPSAPAAPAHGHGDQSPGRPAAAAPAGRSRGQKK